jgi:DNA processing protein
LNIKKKSMKSDLAIRPEEANKNSIGILDLDYPELLKNIYDPPKLLFFKGNRKLLQSKELLTVVGSRKTTDYHLSSLQKIIADLKNTPIVIVSGLAVGIDRMAHRYALDNHLPTIAVLGSSLDERKLYPQENLSLAREIINSGGLLLSEQSPETKTQLWHFPKRNRILAGLSKATVVVSGAKKSGTLITAQVAIDEGREVLALPGNINLILSQGPNKLIKDGAAMMDSAKDILRIYNIDKQINNKKIIFKNKDHAKIYSLLQTEPLKLVALAAKLNKSLADTNILISEMELRGTVKLNNVNQLETI